jgi:hypothetical protein
MQGNEIQFYAVAASLLALAALIALALAGILLKTAQTSFL